MMRPMMKAPLTFLAAAAATLIFAVSAQASSKQLWYNDRVDQIGSDIAGTNLQVLGEDDWNEWASFTYPDDPYAVMGFVSIYASSSSPLYHRVFVSPGYWLTLYGAAVHGAENSGSDRYTTAKAIFTLTHEAYHFRLFSSDEGRVNACALRAFPGVLQSEFGLSPTTTQTGTQAVRVRVRYRVKLHQRWVTRYRWNTTYQSVTTTVPNQVFNELVADAQDFYSRQPAPYNTGTCF